MEIFKYFTKIETQLIMRSMSKTGIAQKIQSYLKALQNDAAYTDREEIRLRSTEDFLRLSKLFSINHLYADIVLIVECLQIDSTDSLQLLKLFQNKNLIIKELKFDITKDSQLVSFQDKDEISSFMDESDQQTHLQQRVGNLECLTINDNHNRLSIQEIEQCVKMINPEKISEIKYYASYDLISKDWFVNFIETCSNLKTLYTEPSQYIYSDIKEYQRLKRPGRKYSFCMGSGLKSTLDNLEIKVVSQEKDVVAKNTMACQDTLETVQIEEMQLTDVKFRQIFSEFNNVVFPLKEILLRRNQFKLITEESQKCFLNLLKGGKVQKIDVSMNQLSQKFCDIVYDAILGKQFKNLLFLDISRNPIKDSGQLSTDIGFL
eukprot:403339658